MAVIKWIVVSDERVARLVSLKRVSGGRWRAEERRSRASRWADYHEHHRPSALGGRSGSSHKHFSPGFSEAEAREERRRFARDVARWIEHDCRNVLDEDSRVAVFAAPGFFGTLREELGERHRRMALHELELTRLRPDELVEHPSVQRVLGIERHATASDEAGDPE